MVPSSSDLQIAHQKTSIRIIPRHGAKVNIRKASESPISIELGEITLTLSKK